ncbi:MAG: NfeD family protein [Eubacterium sp.]|nr:NfeD family protein [Eubacterium sp.]
MAFVANLSMTVFWLVVLVVLVIIELLTMGLTTVWFAGGALVATIASLFHAPLFLQIILFLLVSAVLLFFTRPLAVKYFNKDRVRTNAESLVGRQAIVISEIDNLQGIGQVNVGGMEWSARTRVDGVKLPVGTVTTVLAINGVKLVVEERREV